MPVTGERTQRCSHLLREVSKHIPLYRFYLVLNAVRNRRNLGVEFLGTKSCISDRDSKQVTPKHLLYSETGWQEHPPASPPPSQTLNCHSKMLRIWTQILVVNHSSQSSIRVHSKAVPDVSRLTIRVIPACFRHDLGHLDKLNHAYRSRVSGSAQAAYL